MRPDLAATMTATRSNLNSGAGPPSYRPSLPRRDVHHEAFLALQRLASRRRFDWYQADYATRLNLISSLELALSLELEDTILLAARQGASDVDIARLAGLPAREVRQIIEALADDDREPCGHIMDAGDRMGDDDKERVPGGGSANPW